MTCIGAKRRSTDYLDGRLRGIEHSRVAAHLAECDACVTYFDQIASTRSGLKALPKAIPPARLTYALRVIASKERQLIEESSGSRFRATWNRWMFRFSLMMRPITIPATGGILSSVLLFTALSLSIAATTGVAYHYDTPIALTYESDQADANLVPIELSSKAILNISVDGHGHIRDYDMRDSTNRVVGDASTLTQVSVNLPDIPSVLAITHPITGSISISYIPLGFKL